MLYASILHGVHRVCLLADARIRRCPRSQRHCLGSYHADIAMVDPQELLGGKDPKADLGSGDQECGHTHTKTEKK
jgi:hypothetical protein